MADALTYEHRMSGSDALMWNIEKDPLLRSTITAVALLDRAPDRHRLVERVERGTRLVPRMRQRVVSSPYSVAPPRWAVDPNFDLSYHLRFVKSPGDGTLGDLLHLAEPLAMQGFDRARPLWEFVVVEELADGKAAVIQKIHHAITDGVGGMQIAMHLVDLEREPDPDALGPMPRAPEPDEWSFAQRMVDAGTHELRRQVYRLRRTAGRLPAAASDPRGAAEGLVDMVRSTARMLTPYSAPMSPIMTDRSLSVRFDNLVVPLADLKAAGRASGGKLNDAFVAAVAGGLRRYHEAQGTDAAELRMNMPINVRDDETSGMAGNQFVPARFAVPIDIADPIKHMAAIRELVLAQRAEPALKLSGPIADLLNRFPTSFVTEVFGGMLRGIDFTTSNVPGIPVPVFLGGAQLEALIPFGPLAGAAINVTLVSFLEDLHIGVNMDPAAVTDTGLFVKCLRDAFDEVLKVA
ncbi:MAG TPA: wax ester/triacylglycerol synthase domain-containing protein [Acidimicrobiales bacterium]